MAYAKDNGPRSPIGESVNSLVQTWNKYTGKTKYDLAKYFFASAPLFTATSAIFGTQDVQAPRIALGIFHAGWNLFWMSRCRTTDAMEQVYHDPDPTQYLTRHHFITQEKETWNKLDCKRQLDYESYFHKVWSRISLGASALSAGTGVNSEFAAVAFSVQAIAHYIMRCDYQPPKSQNLESPADMTATIFSPVRANSLETRL